MARLAVFFVLALCAFQAFDALPHGHADGQSGIDDVIAKIKEIIAKVMDQVKIIAKEIEDKVRDVVSKINVDLIVKNIVDKIKQEMEKILNQAGIDPSNVKECVEAAKKQLEALAVQVKAGITKCREAFVAATADVKPQIEAVIKQAIQVREDVTKRVLDCVKNNVGKPADVIACLKNERDAITKEVQELDAKIREVKANTKKIVEDARNGLVQCVKSVHEDSHPKARAIIEEFKKCIHPAQTTTAPVA